MNRRPVVWVQKADEEDEQDPYVIFRIVEDWVSTDSDQLLLPISVLERDGETFDKPQPAILKQYGGEGLLNDMLMSDQPVEKGTEWMLQRLLEELHVEPHQDS